MNEVINHTETEVTAPDKLRQLASEIISIKTQTSAILSAVENTVKLSCFEIGKRLCEAKALMPHGEWGNWLNDNVDYSESTAQNLMRIYKEMGDSQIDLITGKAPSDVFGSYQYSQLVALFALPSSQRIEFVEQNNIEDKSVREIEALIREKNELMKKNEQAQKLIADKEQELSKERKDKEGVKKRYDKAQSELKKQTEELDELKEELENLKEQPVQEIIVEQSEPNPERIEKIREEEREKAKKEYLESSESLSADIEKREKALNDALAEAEERAKEKISALEKKLALASNDGVKLCNFHFTTARTHLIDTVKSIIDLKKDNPDTADKLTAAVAKSLEEILKPIGVMLKNE